MHTSRRSWARSHPVRLAALLGAVVGFGYALALEIGGVLHRNSSSVVQMLWPALNPAGELSQGRILQSAFILAVEFLSNIVVYALLFALPAALIVGIRRVFTSRNGPAAH